LYDSVLFYAPGVAWTEPAPQPSAWVTQLDPALWKGIDPARFRYGDALRAELARLVEDGFLEEIDGAPTDDSRRRVYRMSKRGRAIARAETERLADQVAAARSRKLLPGRS
jgi:hypothetical protein